MEKKKQTKKRKNNSQVLGSQLQDLIVYLYRKFEVSRVKKINVKIYREAILTSTYINDIKKSVNTN